MALPAILMFSGQGSHYYGMGRELFERQPHFRRRLLEMDEAARVWHGSSLVESLYHPDNPRSKPWDRIDETHPVLFMVQYALAEALLDSGLHPTRVLGSSMGEYVAAAVCGVYGWEDLLKSLILQARTLELRCEEGFMAAILHSTSLYWEEDALRLQCEMVGQNFDSHFVVSGPRRNLDSVSRILQAKGAAFQVLQVTQAFHSSVIDFAEAECLECLSALVPRRPAFPLLSCVAGGRLETLSPSHLWDAVRGSIRFREVLAGLMVDGDHAFVDAGPSGTLATFVRYNLPAASASRVLPILTPFGKDIAGFSSVIRYFRD